ncbi:MAG: phage terminase small subunit P27 family [Chloroflexota bacterium]
MGQRGPKPKRAALKLLAGNPGKRPVRADGEPKRGRVRRGVPDRPRELTGEAAREWDRVAADLDAAGTLAVADRGILAAYCLAVADLLAARDAINREGRFVKEPVQTSKGEKIGERTREHPAVRLLDRASARVQRLADSLGLTPQSRSRSEAGEAAAGPTAGNRVTAIREKIEAARNGG